MTFRNPIRALSELIADIGLSELVQDIVTGAILRTASTGERIQLWKTGVAHVIQFINSSNVVNAQILHTTGTAFTLSTTDSSMVATA